MESNKGHKNYLDSNDNHDQGGLYDLLPKSSLPSSKLKNIKQWQSTSALTSSPESHKIILTTDSNESSSPERTHSSPSTNQMVKNSSPVKRTLSLVRKRKTHSLQGKDDGEVLSSSDNPFFDTNEEVGIEKRTSLGRLFPHEPSQNSIDSKRHLFGGSSPGDQDNFDQDFYRKKMQQIETHLTKLQLEYLEMVKTLEAISKGSVDFKIPVSENYKTTPQSQKEGSMQKVETNSDKSLFKVYNEEAMNDYLHETFFESKAREQIHLRIHSRLENINRFWVIFIAFFLSIGTVFSTSNLVSDKTNIWIQWVVTISLILSSFGNAVYVNQNYGKRMELFALAAKQYKAFAQKLMEKLMLRNIKESDFKMVISRMQELDNNNPVVVIKEADVETQREKYYVGGQEETAKSTPPRHNFFSLCMKKETGASPELENENRHFELMNHFAQENEILKSYLTRTNEMLQIIMQQTKSQNENEKNHVPPLEVNNFNHVKEWIHSSGSPRDEEDFVSDSTLSVSEVEPPPIKFPILKRIAVETMKQNQEPPKSPPGSRVLKFAKSMEISTKEDAPKDETPKEEKSRRKQSLGISRNRESVRNILDKEYARPLSLI